MKSQLTLVLALVSLAWVVACGGASAPSTSEAAGAENASAAPGGKADNSSNSTAKPNTIECYSDWFAPRFSQASISFDLDSDGLPKHMTSRFDVTGDADVTSKIVTITGAGPAWDGAYVQVAINPGTDKEINLAFASPEYKNSNGSKLHVFKGDITSFPNVTPDTTVDIHDMSVRVGNGLIEGMNCWLWDNVADDRAYRTAEGSTSKR